MLTGDYTPNGAMPNFGGWADFVLQAQNAYTARGVAGVRAVVNVNPAALRLLSGDEPATSGRRYARLRANSSRLNYHLPPG